MTTSEGAYSIDATEGEDAGVIFKGPEGETRFGAKRRPLRRTRLGAGPIPALPTPRT